MTSARLAQWLVWGALTAVVRCLVWAVVYYLLYTTDYGFVCAGTILTYPLARAVVACAPWRSVNQ